SNSREENTAVFRELPNRPNQPPRCAAIYRGTQHIRLFVEIDSSVPLRAQHDPRKSRRLGLHPGESGPWSGFTSDCSGSSEVDGNSRRGTATVGTFGAAAANDGGIGPPDRRAPRRVVRAAVEVLRSRQTDTIN